VVSEFVELLSNRLPPTDYQLPITDYHLTSFLNLKKGSWQWFTVATRFNRENKKGQPFLANGYPLRGKYQIFFRIGSASGTYGRYHLGAYPA
jgi:hypothetical protein